jgi:anti-anti-sigma factor
MTGRLDSQGFTVWKAPFMLDGSHFSLLFSRSLGKVVVRVRGTLNARTAPALRARLVDVIDNQGNRSVVVELQEMTAVDNAGLFVLADALRRMDSQGGELLLSGPTPRVHEQLRAFGVGSCWITPEWKHPARGGLGLDRRWYDERPANGA